MTRLDHMRLIADRVFRLLELGYQWDQVREIVVFGKPPVLRVIQGAGGAS